MHKVHILWEGNIVSKNLQLYSETTKIFFSIFLEFSQYMNFEKGPQNRIFVGIIFFYFTLWSRILGSFNNHVGQFVPNFDLLPPRVDNCGHFTWYLLFITLPSVDFLLPPPLPPSSCPCSYWMTPSTNFFHHIVSTEVFAILHRLFG